MHEMKSLINQNISLTPMFWSNVDSEELETA